MNNRKMNAKENAVARVADELLWLSVNWAELPGEVQLREIRLKVPATDGGDWLSIIKGYTVEGEVVAFVSAPELDTLVHLVAAKLANGTIQFREDKPYAGR